ncbi:MAG: phage major capsid protein [Clostridiales bacterium]|nr:phage major capsid protein [Clostridiales bacterium]
MTVKELREKRNKAWNDAKAFLDAHTTENGTLSAEDSATYDKMEADIKNLGDQIARVERAAEIEAQLAQPTSNPLTGKPGASDNGKSARATDEYRQAAITAIRTNFKNVSNYLQTGVDADGGYLVPEEWDKRLIVGLDDANIMRKLGTVIKTTGLHRINLVATKPAAAWIEEGGALTFADDSPKFDQVTLDAYKLHVAVKVTEELLYDNAYNLEAHILDQFGKAIANAEEDTFLNGDGSGKPTGVFTDATVADTVSEVTSDSIIDLVYGLKRPYRKNAVFVMNDTLVASVRKLKDSNGSYIWQPSYQAGEPDTILGYKVYTSAYAPTTGIAFGDFSYYNIGDRGTRSFAELRELFAGNGMIGYVAKERVDGKLVLPEAVQVLSISDAG